MDAALACFDDQTALQYVDGNLSPERRAQIDRHIGACEKCRQLLGDAASLPGPEAEPGKEADTAPETLAGRDRYTILAEHGRGGQARILLAFDEKIGREVALKELLPAGDEKTDDRSWRDAMARFQREAELTGQLSHPGVVPVFDIETRADGTLFYTMQLVRGRTLSEVLRERRPLQDRLGLLSHFLSVCHVVAFAHSRGVVHRDIKPQNIMVGEFGETVLLDWGLAKQQSDEPESMPLFPRASASMPDTATREGMSLGTPGYMSPEQASGALSEVDERSDIYGLGAVLFEILTGESPPQLSLQEAVWRRRHGPPIRELCRVAPPELTAVANKALAIEKRDRYQNASDLAQDVAAFMTGGKVAAFSYTRWDLVRRFAARHRLLLGSAAALLAVILSAVVLLAIAWRSELISRRAAEVSQRAAEESREEATARGHEALQEGAKLAFVQGDMLQARAKLRGALELGDSLAARALWQKLRADPVHFVAHLGWHVLAVAFSPDGTELAAGLQNGNLGLLDVATQATRPVRGDHETIKTIAYSPDGRFLAAGGERSGRIALWDRQSGKLDILGERSTRIGGIAFRPDGLLLAAAHAGGEVVLWNIQTRSVEARLPMSGQTVLSVAFSPDGRLLAASSRLDRVVLWDLGSRSPLFSRSGSFYGVAFSSDGALLAAGGIDGGIRLWETGSGELVRTLRGHDAAVIRLTTSQEGRLLASASADGTARLWKLPAGVLVRTLRTGKDLVYDVAFSARGNLLAAAAVDSVWVWEVESAQVPQALQALPSKNLNRALFSPDGAHIVSAGEDGLVRLWDRNGALQARWAVHDVPARDLCLSPDGGFIASVGVDGALVVQEGQSGAIRHRLFSSDRLRAVACSPDSVHVVAGGSEGVARIWDARLGKLMRAIGSRPNDTLFALLYTADGRRIIAGHHSGLIEIWDSASGRLQFTLKGHTDLIEGLAIDRAGRTLASTARDRSVRLWNLADGKGRRLAVADDRMLRPSWDRAGRRLAVPTYNGEILVWDASSGDLLARVGAHREEVNSVEISPDGLSAVSAGEDGVLRLWETQSWRPRWFARATLSTPQLELLTHAGWHALDSARRLVPVAPPEGNWLRAVESSREAVQQPGGPICVASDSGLAIWDVQRDAQILFEPLAAPFEVVSLPAGCSVLKDGRVTLYRPGEIPREVADDARFQSGGERLTTIGSAIGLFDAEGGPRGTFGRGDGATAAAPFGERVAVGFSDGAIELRDTSERAPVYFKETPASAVTRLAMGPSGTLVAGFADGSLGVWNASSGELLERSAVHGAVQQLIVHGGMLVAASEVGNLAALDLSLLTADYCSLLQEVWSRVPVLWREKGAVVQAPNPYHFCQRSRR